MAGLSRSFLIIFRSFRHVYLIIYLKKRTILLQRYNDLNYFCQILNIICYLKKKYYQYMLFSSIWVFKDK